MVTLCYLDIMPKVVEFLKQAVLRSREEAEVCGLLGGQLKDTEGAVASTVHPLSNLSLRKDSFAVDVEEFCRERDAIEEAGLMPVALYHSHHHNSTRPSFRDRELPGITGIPSLILAWDGNKLHFECYGKVDNRIMPITVISQDAN